MPRAGNKQSVRNRELLFAAPTPLLLGTGQVNLRQMADEGRSP
jgi:hypothetical protein